MSTAVTHINSIAAYHSFHNLSRPKHPLVSVINFDDIKHEGGVSLKISNDFYCVALKRLYDGKMKYGQQEYDFNEGVLAFLAPKQVMSIDVALGHTLQHDGWLLIFHPDFLWNTTLAKKIKQYDFFGYQLKEALHLSENEERQLLRIMQDINTEYHSNIDSFSQDVIISQLDLLLTYSERFYQRQFYTRKKAHHTVLEKFEEELNSYFSDENSSNNGLPSVKNIASSLNVSPNYLSRLLKSITGKTAQECIHNKLIQLAKEQLSTTGNPVNEIAYRLGFEHPQSFSKLFKKKTELTPLEFRKAFN